MCEKMVSSKIIDLLLCNEQIDLVLLSVSNFKDTRHVLLALS